MGCALALTVSNSAQLWHLACASIFLMPAMFPDSCRTPRPVADTGCIILFHISVLVIRGCGLCSTTMRLLARRYFQTVLVVQCGLCAGVCQCDGQAERLRTLP